VLHSHSRVKAKECLLEISNTRANNVAKRSATGCCLKRLIACARRRLRQAVFRLQSTGQFERAELGAPIDVLETEREVMILVAYALRRS